MTTRRKRTSFPPAPDFVRARDVPGCDLLFMPGWAWPVPEAFRNCIGHQWAVRVKDGRRTHGWVDSGVGAFHRGAVIYDHPAGYFLPLEQLRQAGVRYMIQIEPSAQDSENSSDEVTYQWYRITEDSGVELLDVGLRGCTQAQFIERLRRGMQPPVSAEAADRILIPQHLEPTPGGICIHYRSADGDFTERVVSKIVRSSPTRIEGFCHLRRQRRSFRLEDIQLAWDSMTGEQIDPDTLGS